MTFDQMVEKVKNGVNCESLLTKSKGSRKKFCCEYCGSGTKANGTGAVSIYLDNTWYCFSCKAHGDVIDLIKKQNNVDFKEAVKIGMDMLGGAVQSPQKVARQTDKKRSDVDFRRYYVDCRKNLSNQEAVNYLNSRGISYDTAHNLFIGYDSKSDPVFAPGGNGKIKYPVKRLIIPTKKDHYVARAIEPAEYPKINNKDGSPGIFNEKALAKNDIVFVSEGVFDALSYEEIGYHAIAINSTSNVNNLLSAVKSSGSDAVFIISFDNDKDPETNKQTREAEKELLTGLTNMGKSCIIKSMSGDEKDANDALIADKNGFKARVEKAYNEAKLLKESATPETNDLQIHEAVELIQDPEPEWEPLAKGKGLPQFPLNRLPYWVQEHIDGFSATTGVSKDYCASAVLGTVSSVVVGHIDVLFNGTHREPVQLYSCFVGSSGTMKSSVINHFMKPATEWLRENNDLTRKTNYAVEKQIEDLERSISAEQKSGKKRDPGKVKDLVEQLNQKRQERHNNFPLPWDDVTPESLINAMKFSRGTANIATAEGNIINVITGRSYTQRGAVQNIDVFLKGSDGESIHQNRITSGETDIPRADISMLLAIQPGLLERLCKSPDAVGRGLAQRFLVYAPEDENKTIDHSIPVAMDPEHMQRWTEHIEYIASRYMDPDQPAKLMELDADADKIIRQFWNYEAELIRERGSADEDSITGWLAKCHGKAIRVSALLALLRDKNAMTITGQDAENAVELFKEYYIPMFIASYERPDFLTQAERMIVNWIIRHHNHVDGHDSFSQRDIWIDLRQRTIFTGKPGAEQFTEALEQLQERNYIRPMLSKRTSSGRGRPAKEWLVNPEVFKK